MPRNNKTRNNNNNNNGWRNVDWPMSQIEFRKQRRELNRERDMVMQEIDRLKACRNSNIKGWLSNSLFAELNAQARGFNEQLTNLVRAQFTGHNMLDLHSMWTESAKPVVNVFLAKAIELGYPKVTIMTGFGDGTMFTKMMEHIQHNYPSFEVTAGPKHQNRQNSSMILVQLR